MTKDEYIKWKSDRHVDPSWWDREKCVAADALIRSTAIRNLVQRTNGWPLNKQVSDFVITMVRCHYGSVEVDELLKSLNCYEDWM